ncbi:MAG: carboxypeptidase-like regulatory domain-containing protein [Aeromicrobium sp.]
MRSRPVRHVAAALLSVLLISGALVAASVPASADPTTGTISGKVTDEAGQPLAGVLVMRTDGDAAYTDDLGTYSLVTDLGDVVLAFSKEDYEYELYDNAQDYYTATHLTLRAGQPLTGVDAVLSRPQPRYSAMPGQVNMIIEDNGVRQVVAAPAGQWSTGNVNVSPSELAIGYQWSYTSGYGAARTFAPIPGATGSTYTTGPADLGSYLAVTITASHPKLKTAAVTFSTSDPFMVRSDVIVSGAKLSRKKVFRMSVKVTAPGMPYATGKVRANCNYKLGKGTSSPLTVLKKGRATLTFKARGMKKRDKRAYCKVYYGGASTTRSSSEPYSPSSSGFVVKIKRKQGR